MYSVNNTHNNNNALTIFLFIIPYGRSKLMVVDQVEQILEDFRAAYGLEYASLHYFNVAGAVVIRMVK